MLQKENATSLKVVKTFCVCWVAYISLVSDTRVPESDWFLSVLPEVAFRSTEKGHELCKKYCARACSPGILFCDQCVRRNTDMRVHIRSYRVFLTGTRVYSRGRDTDASASPHSSRTAYYDILNISPNATQAQIKTAYYKQSLIHHPDRNRGDDAARRFTLIAEAYSVLGSVALRRRYDRGALTHSDAQAAGRPSSSARHQGPRRASDARFDFDAFYRAHYGEQLQREKQTRHKREEFQRQQREEFTRWKVRKLTEMTVGFLLLSGGVLLINLRST